MKFTQSTTLFVTILALCVIVWYQWVPVEMVYHFQTNTAPCADEAQKDCSAIFEHIYSVRTMITVVFSETGTAIGALLAVFLLGVFTAFRRGSGEWTQSGPVLPSRLFRPLTECLDYFSFDYLQIAFARGILNSKIY